MKISPPTKSRPFVVSITAEGPWAVDHQDPNLLPGTIAFSVEQNLDVNSMRVFTSVRVSLPVTASNPSEAIAVVLERVDHAKSFYPGWLNDATVYEVSVCYQAKESMNAG